MISDRGSFPSLLIPSNWNQPRFNFDQPVLFEKFGQHSRARVIGLEWIDPSNAQVSDGVSIGWWYSLELLEGEARYEIEPFVWLPENVIQPDSEVRQLEYVEPLVI